MRSPLVVCVGNRAGLSQREVFSAKLLQERFGWFCGRELRLLVRFLGRRILKKGLINLGLNPIRYFFQRLCTISIDLRC